MAARGKLRCPVRFRTATPGNVIRNFSPAPQRMGRGVTTLPREINNTPFLTLENCEIGLTDRSQLLPSDPMADQPVECDISIGYHRNNERDLQAVFVSAL